MKRFVSLVFGHRLEDFDRGKERFVVFSRRLGPPVVVGVGFRLFMLVPQDAACNRVVGVRGTYVG